MPPPLHFVHVDVFSRRPYSGNSLAVFPDGDALTAPQMAAITRELRHFESVFLAPGGGKQHIRARVFDLMGELDFAGHPVIGAACVLHARQGAAAEATENWIIRLNARTVSAKTERRSSHFFALLDQGEADFIASPPRSLGDEIASWFSLSRDDLVVGLAPEIVSTGLRYLVLPVRPAALARARIDVSDLETRLARLGAEFAYLLDVEGMEGRHWNNDGLLEDVATGSGAGCVAAYLRCHGVLGDGETIILNQGRFVGRPSEITLQAHGEGRAVRSVLVGGAVALVGAGRMDVIPEEG